MGLYRALTMDTYRLLQKDIRVGPDQNQKEHLDRPKVLGKERRCDSDTPRAPAKDHWYSSSIMAKPTQETLGVTPEDDILSECIIVS